jgi:hypothetical protein
VVHIDAFITLFIEAVKDNGANNKSFLYGVVTAGPPGKINNLPKVTRLIR